MNVSNLNAGNLRHLVTLQQRAAGVDALGQANGAWTAVATVWADVQPVRGRERLAAAQVQDETDVRFVIRYRSDVRPAWRVVWNGQAHGITAVIDLEGRHEVLELLTTAGARDG